MIVVVEHLEPCINRWILAEYSYVASLFPGRTWFTNVRRGASALRKLGKVFSESCVDLLRNRKVVVLDPQAPKPLTRDDLLSAEFVVIGGIMGSHPPEGRTKRFLTDRMPWAEPRNLGREQMTIAGAARVLKLVEDGAELSSVRIVRGLRIAEELGKGVSHVIELPYAFPAREDGSPDLPPRYLEIVREYAVVYEQRVLRSADECVDDYDDS
ncbi:MAG: hypothetical protein GXO32_01065 [Crenarchaeota archaeon]|nr:hypothetical protein [Thermoproteota archaeon]